MFVTLFFSHYNKRVGYHLMLIMVVAILLSGCSHGNDGMVRGRRAVTELMDSVESIVDDNASLADSLMQLIDSHSIHNRGQRARYALLSTQAQYKNYRLITTDSLIMEAVRYYSINKNLNYRFLSYYYLGCAYMDMQRNTDASVVLAQAERMVDQIDNDYWKGLLYYQLGFLFNESDNFKLAEEYFIKSEKCYSCAGKELHKLYALYYVGSVKKNLNEFDAADSIYRIVEIEAQRVGDMVLYNDCVYNRFSCVVYMNKLDSATLMLKNYDLLKDQVPPTFGYLEVMALYYNHIKDYEKSGLYLEKARQCIITETDSIYWFYVSSLLAESLGKYKESLDLYRDYIYIQNASLSALLNQPVAIAQRDYYRTASELEAIKFRNKITMLVASIIILILIVFSGLIYNRNKRLETQKRISLYLSTIEELTTQASLDHNKISNLNAQVREMLRQQFSSSDFLYTRYYEQIDDSKKAERLYRIVKNQIDDFTSHKNIGKIDELLNGTFDGVMDDILSSGLDLKEKDLLLLRFVLAGFSAKSIATLLNDTHPNITQRKKRLLDKIAVVAPDLMEKLRIALNSK